MLRKLFLLILVCITGYSLFGEDRGQGLDPLPSGLNQSMTQAQPKGLVTRENGAPGDGAGKTSLPSRVDLSQFLPPIRNQGPIGSCSAWSSVYYAKTIQENQERMWGADSPSHQFSPLFTYNQITEGVNRGTSITEHMILIEKQGVPPLSVFPYTDNLRVLPDERVLREALNFRSVSHKNLDEYDYSSKTWSVDLMTVKTALADGLPVVGGFTVYENFYYYTGGIYNRTSGAASGGHAMCIVGYDDSRNAFRIVNSWGTSWGEDGFLWLSYDLFEELCVNGCAVMYDLIDTVPDSIPAPGDIRGSKGVYTDRIEISWQEIDGADFYLVYRGDNEKGILEEAGRTEKPFYSDDSLPPGVTYVYAVKSGITGSRLISDFSEIVEGWTGEEKTVPGIPGGLTYALYREEPLLIWDPVETAEGYTVYRWDDGKEAFLKIGSSTDSTYLDRTFGKIPGGGIVYYIVEAFNSYGAGFATDSLAVLKEMPYAPPEEAAPAVSEADIRDDETVAESARTSFRGAYYRTDYFDYEYTMARFREYYEKEQEAFRKFRQEEQSGFEDWKRQQDEAFRNFRGR